MAKIVNVAAYKFIELQNLKSLRATLLELCKGWGLKGTILLSSEGINLFVAGRQEQIDLLLARLRDLPGLADLQGKLSETDHQPFRRMLVRIKKEIIAFGVEGIHPGKRTSPKLPPTELKRWLDEGRPVTLLDTRNDYEVKLGTFKNALPIGIDHFRDFPQAVKRLPQELKDQPVVMFCTGGIRCEKAGPFMESIGFKNILQLEGGILKYFEECGGAHYDGECFVFDQRTGVDPTLHETRSATCYTCQTPLTEGEQNDIRYVPGQSCPYCFKTPGERMALQIADRHEVIRSVTTPLPGSRPYENLRPINIPSRCDGLALVEALSQIVKSVSSGEWQDKCESGLLLNAAHEPSPANQIVRTGERYFHKQAGLTEPDISAEIKILHEDEALVVINKPAPLPVHAGGRFNRNTLQYILNQVYHPQRPRPAHRLDANTTGLMLVTRTRHFAARLQPQFARGAVEKVYLVKVQGVAPQENEFTCDTPISQEPGETGTRTVDTTTGLAAITRFRVVQRYADQTTLLEARPLTGRTNQIRVHLWHLGLPVWGDPTYLPGQRMGTIQTLKPGDPPLCLHCWRMSFKHPLDGKNMEFTAPLPDWAGDEELLPGSWLEKVGDCASKQELL